jgi:hypothetical protein
LIGDQDGINPLALKNIDQICGMSKYLGACDARANPPVIVKEGHRNAAPRALTPHLPRMYPALRASSDDEASLQSTVAQTATKTGVIPGPPSKSSDVTCSNVTPINGIDEKKIQPEGRTVHEQLQTVRAF